jgi:hypothetical protein
VIQNSSDIYYSHCQGEGGYLCWFLQVSVSWGLNYSEPRSVWTIRPACNSSKIDYHLSRYNINIAGRYAKGHEW